MWQRFTQTAREAVFQAQNEAQHFRVSHIGALHLLLALLQQSDSVAVRILRRLNVSPEAVREEAEKRAEWGNREADGGVDLTPRFKRVIDLAFNEAQQLHNNYIGTEHLLLGLIGEEIDLPDPLFPRFGIDLEATRREFVRLQDSSLEAPRYGLIREYALLSDAERAALREPGIPFGQLPERIGATVRRMYTLRVDLDAYPETIVRLVPESSDGREGVSVYADVAARLWTAD